jgi:hypothetical protein
MEELSQKSDFRKHERILTGDSLEWQRLAMCPPRAVFFSLGFSKLFSASSFCGQ